MKVVSLKICPFVQRVVAQLEAKGLEYEVEYIESKNRPQWFLDISPNGQVPVLITDTGQALFESDAIVEYLEEAHGPLQPGLSFEEKATNRAWSHMASKNYLVQCSAQRSLDAATLGERSERLDQAFDNAEGRLDGGAFFGGSTIGTVDVAWLPLLHRADIIRRHSGHDFLGDRPKLKAWQRRLLDTGLTEKSVAPDFEDVFTGFYLSEETLLGSGRDVSAADTREGGGSGRSSCG